MRKYLLSLFLILTLLCSVLWASFGQFGTGTGARDTVYLWFDAFDTLGQQVNVDTVMWIIRYGATLVDSTRKVGSTSDDALSPGRYVWQKRAYDGTHQGSYNVEFRWSVNGNKKFHREKSYTVFDTVTTPRSNYTLASSQTFNMTGNVTGNLSGSVGSVTADVGITQGGADKVWGTTSRTITGGTVTTATSVTNDVGITQAGADKVWGTTARALTDKAGFFLATSQTFNNTGSWTGSISGSVGSVTGSTGSVTGSVGSVTANVNINSNSDITAIKAKTDKMRFYGTNPNDTAIVSYGVNASGSCPTAAEIWAYATRSLTDKIGFGLSGTQTFNNTGSWTGNITGNVSGSVGSVTGSVGSVTGSVASVTGNVGGNVGGSVASVTGAVGSVTGNVGGSVASVTGAVGSVTGAVGSVTSAVTVGTNNDKTNYLLSAQGNANILTQDTTGMNTGWAQVWKSTNNKTNKLTFDPQDSLIIDYGRIPAGGGSATNPDTIANHVWIWTTRTLTSGSGTGANQVTVYTLQSPATPIADVQVQILNQGQTATMGLLSSDASGKSVFAQNNGIYKLRMVKTGWQFTVPESIIVVGNTADTFFASIFNPGSPPSPSLCRVYGWVNNLSGAGDSGTVIAARIKTSPLRYQTAIISPYEKRDTTNSQGYWYLDLYPDTLLTPSGTKYEFMMFKTVGTIRKDTAVIVPNQSCWQYQW